MTTTNNDEQQFAPAVLLELDPATVHAEPSAIPPDTLATLREVARVMEKAKRLLRAAGLTMGGGTISEPYNAALEKLNALLAGQAAQPSTIPPAPSTGDHKLNPVEPKALADSITELDEWLETDGCDPLTQSQSESVMLVLHELKRLRATSTAAGQAAQPSTIPPAPCPECNSNYPLHDLDCKTGRGRSVAKDAAGQAVQPVSADDHDA